MIIIRTLRRDIARYNSMEDSAEEALEESGWKLVHGDVFRPPRYPRLFASLIGSGIQILGMSVVTICKILSCHIDSILANSLLFINTTFSCLQFLRCWECCLLRQEVVALISRC